MEGQGEGGKRGGRGRERAKRKVLTSFSPWGANPFWKCDIWHNRILSAGKPQASRTHTRTERGFTHAKC